MPCFQKAPGMLLIAFVLLRFINLITSQDADVIPLPEEGSGELTVQCSVTYETCGRDQLTCCHRWVCTGYCIPDSKRDAEVEMLSEREGANYSNPYCGDWTHPCGDKLPRCCTGLICTGFCLLK